MTAANERMAYSEVEVMAWMRGCGDAGPVEFWMCTHEAAAQNALAVIEGREPDECGECERIVGDRKIVTFRARPTETETA